ncbi:hypothetical protein A6A05_01230 [Magnetospirillum moscoviense]|uniref:Uncharacterized protein n=2 Tax=Magnetospirillum moscoviense TaxID=1437059 RepID=A0A178MRE9_9PROT|nr:hypothetical protein A6A05_01230 [Magnetospirillum moscoviense]
MRRSFLSFLAIVGAVLLSPQAARASEARLWIVPPSSPASLSDCPAHAATALGAHSTAARRLTSRAVVRWRDGQVALGTDDDATGSKAGLWDQCFALEVDGRVIVSGAILLPHSARLLRVPVLALRSWRDGDSRLEFDLIPAFPAHAATISEREWQDRLAPLR